MPNIQYQLPGWPAAVNGHSAAMPRLTRAAGSGAQSYKLRVTGQPGTQAIPAPAPPVPEGGRVARALMGQARSSDAPNVFYPNLYYVGGLTEFPGAGMPISIYSDNLMPVPATDPRGVPSTQQMPLRQRGQRQIRWPARLPRWPSVNAS